LFILTGLRKFALIRKEGMESTELKKGWKCSSDRSTRNSLRFPVKINILENDRKVEDIRVDVRFDGWEAKRTGCTLCPKACLLINSTET